MRHPVPFSIIFSRVTSSKLSRRILTPMNVGQLQVILNYLLTQIETLNENLVEYLITRDELAIEQDSLLTGHLKWEWPINFSTWVKHNLKFALSEKHTKFEKIFLMGKHPLIFQLVIKIDKETFIDLYLFDLFLLLFESLI